MTQPTLEIHGIVKKKRRWPAVLATSVLLLGLGTVGGGWAYADYYRELALPNTKVGELELAGNTRAEIEAALQHQCDTLKVTLTGAAKATKTLKELGLDCDVAATASAVMAPNRHLGEILKSTVMEHRIKAQATTDTNRATLAARDIAARDLATENPNPVLDPHLDFNAETQEFTVAPGVPGKGIDPQTLLDAAQKAWETQENQSLETQLTEVAPLPPSPDLPAWAQAATQMVQPRVNLVSYGISHFIPREDKAKWITVTDQGPQFDRKAIESWLATFTDENIDIKNEPGQRIVTKDGYLLQLITTAWPSRIVSNNGEIAAELLEALQAGEGYTGYFELERREGTYVDTPAGQDLPRPYDAAPGQRWIGVDIENHTTTAWEGDKVVIGPIASVNGSLPSPTYSGIFRIQTKLVSTRMKGEGWDGEYDVIAPYTMYYNGGYALHGAPWRYDFIYRPYGGSHGCTNLPIEWAKRFFEFASIGTPIVVHRNGVI